MRLIVTAALVAASISANAGIPSEAHNPELVIMGKQAVAALTCAAWASYLVPRKDDKNPPYYMSASYTKEVTRLRAYGLKTGRAFIDRIKEVTNGDANSQLPSYYSMYLDYSQGTDFALGQLTKEVSESVVSQFKMKDTVDKVSYDPAIWRIYASTAYSEGHCDLIGYKS